MTRNTIFVSIAILTLLLPPLVAADELPYTAEGKGANSAPICRENLALELGGCASREARGTLTGSLAACVPEDRTLTQFTCWVHWTLALTSSGALPGCFEATSSVNPYLVGCAYNAAEQYEAVSQPYNVTYTDIPLGPSHEEEWVRTCIDIGTALQRCSPPVTVRFVFNIQSANTNAVLSVTEQVNQAYEVVAGFASDDLTDSVYGA